MNHLTDLQLSMCVDDALLPEDTESVNAHLASCDVCRARLQAYSEEKRILRASLASDDGIQVPDFEMPAFSRPITLKGFALANVATGLIIWLTQFLWKTIFGELVVNALARITELYIPDVFELSVSTALYFSKEGTLMIDTYFGYIVTVFVAMTIAWIAFAYRKTRMMVSLSLVVVTTTGVLLPAPASALEVRRSEGIITVAADETLDDTVFLAGETIIVDGEVTGDLIAAGQRIVINGVVGGNLITMGESISILGQVAGTTMSAGESIDLSDAAIEGDFWGAASSVTMNRDARIGRNATIATEKTSLSGRIDRDFTGFSETIEISGQVGGDVEAFSAELRLLGEAIVGGGLRFHSDDEDNLTQSTGAAVKGETEFVSMTDEIEKRSRYVRGEFYVSQLLQLVAAFIVGIVILWLVPVLRDETLDGGMEGFKTAGIGLITLVSVPVVMLLLAVTLVGLPLAVIGLATWFVAVYLAKIVLASVIGQMMLNGTAREDSLMLTLLAGLAAIMLVTNIPAIGGIISFILTIVGLGLIVQLVLAYTSDLYHRA